MRPNASITQAATKVRLLAASLLLGPLPSTLTPEYLRSFLAAMACSHQIPRKRCSAVFWCRRRVAGAAAATLRTQVQGTPLTLE